MTGPIPADYPSKRSLTETEANNALKNGPELKWFEPWAERAVNISDITPHPYGYTHVYNTAHGGFNYDFASFGNKEDLALGLEDLWRRHTGRGFTTDPTFPKCRDCQGIIYFAPDEPLRLYLVIEQDDDGDDPSDEGGADQ